MVKVASIWSRLGEVASLVATPLLPSHYVQLLRPLSATHTRQARVEAIRDEAPGVKTFVLRPGRGWGGHQAGQHIRVGLAIDGRLVTRTYSISSPPERRGGCIEITVKAQGRVSNALHAVEVGGFVSIGPAMGEFVLPQGGAARLLFITGGSGITPIASMVRGLAARDAMPEVVHVHYARTADDVIFGEELRSLAVDHPNYHFVEVHTASDRRRFDAKRLGELVPDWRTREAWACGPQSLLDAIAIVYAANQPHVGPALGRPVDQPDAGPGLDQRVDLSHVGPALGRPVDRSHAGPALGRPVDRSHVGPVLHVERFRAALTVLPANASGGRARFAMTATQTTTDADADATTPLLHVAERAGLAPRSGCRMGICHTCDSTLVSGCVRDLRSGTTIDEPGTRVQICVCAAAGDVELSL